VHDDNLIFFAFTFVRALFKIWRSKIDTAVDLELFSRCTALVSYLSGAANRVGFHNYTAEGLYRGSLLTHPVLYNPHQHMALNFLGLVLALEAPFGELPLLKQNVKAELVDLPVFLPPAAEAVKMREAIRAINPRLGGTSQIVILNPDPGLLPLRGWPLENFAALAEAIVKAEPNSVIITAGLGRSRSHAKAIQERVPVQNFVDFTGQTKSLSELLVLFSISRMLITNDSGPAHMASLAALKTLVLFGPETPALYGPLGDKVQCFFADLSCSPCVAAANHRRTFCSNNRCLQAITVEQVLQAALNALRS
jgi:ADP-heptose:LPS heptosyltransferase